MQGIRTLDFSGKKTLIRVDFNVPLNDQFKVSDNTRIIAALPTINHVLSKGGKVILMSHLGRPKDREDAFSLKHIVSELSRLTGKEIAFDEMQNLNVTRERCNNLNEGEILLLENLRYDEREKKGDESMAKELAGLCDIYVNDAFGTAHRAHASTAIIAKFIEEKCFGLLMENEIESLDKVLFRSEKPVTAIIGGAKVSSKLDVILNLIEKCDNLIIGGGMAYTFAKAMGGQIGTSLFEEDKIDEALKTMQLAKENNVNLLLPIDTIITEDFAPDAVSKVSKTNEIPSGWMGLDIGLETVNHFEKTILESKTILWNGPMGVFEFDNFANGTIAIANAIVKATEKGAFSLVGGGDSVAALKKFNLAEKVSYVSTGGGAMLEYMEGKTLPGIAAMRS